ncbi:MAG TPA: hypothetical protein VGF53_03475 [Pseudolabrys sp.]|jgi:hypothetical protein
MRVWAEAKQTALLIAAMAAAGFALTLYVFYPGIQTFDALYIYKDMAKGFYGDWQSPVMIVLWSLVDPIAPGTGSLLLLTVTLYWLAFAVVAMTVARDSPRLALILPLLALSPPAFIFVGIIWRDVLFSISWLLAAAIVFAAANRSRKARVTAQAIGLALLAFGVLLRPNALAAAPILMAYIVWPSRFIWKRAAILYVPAALGLFGLVQVIYYGVLGATRQQPLHSIMVFDLGGVSHFAKDNVFPGPWTADEAKLITNGCYQPLAWDIYWTQQPCLFVMEHLEREKLFPAPALTDAWKHAIVSHPIAYLEHRANFMWTFLAGANNLTMWTRDLDDAEKIIFADNPRLMALKAVHDFLKPTPLFRAGTWLLIDAITCLIAWRRRDAPAGAFALGVCGSAILYTMTFFAVGVATDFRYAYWAVLAGLTGTVAIASRRTA